MHGRLLILCLRRAGQSRVRHQPLFSCRCPSAGDSVRPARSPTRSSQANGNCPDFQSPSMSIREFWYVTAEATIVISVCWRGFKFNFNSISLYFPFWFYFNCKWFLVCYVLCSARVLILIGALHIFLCWWRLMSSINEPNNSSLVVACIDLCACLCGELFKSLFANYLNISRTALSV